MPHASARPQTAVDAGAIVLEQADPATAAALLLVPPEAGGFMTMTVEEGTRRFQGASGQLELIWEKSGALECPDIVCLTGAIFEPVVFEGSPIVPRP